MASWLGRFFRSFTTNAVVVFDTSSLQNLSVDLLGVPSIVRAINLIATDSARLDMTVTRRDGSVVEDSPAVELLKGDSASFLSGFELRRWIATSALTHGNGFLFIRRDLTTGAPVALDPIDSSAVTVELNGTQARYKINDRAVDDATSSTSAPSPIPSRRGSGCLPLSSAAASCRPKPSSTRLRRNSRKPALSESSPWNTPGH